MNKILKTTLLIFIAILGAGFLLVSPVSAQTDPLVVQFENVPPALHLFQETNLVPGDSVTRWIKVTNNSGLTQKIAIEAINHPNPILPEDLSRALGIVIKQGSTDLYGGTSAGEAKLLYDFYNDGENYLSDLANGDTVQYDIIISFPSDKGDYWQTKTTGFDILIGFQGTDDKGETGGGTIGGVITGGGGGGLPQGLTITNETATTTCDTAIITWLTSYPATTQVVYSSSAEPHTFDLYAPNYGYSHAYPDPENTAKTTGHTVTIPSLTPGATYYYRAISHASPATITLERAFTTRPNIPGCACYKSPELPSNFNTLPDATNGLNLPGSGAASGLLPNPSEDLFLPPLERLAYIPSGNDAKSPVFDDISGNGISTTSEEELSFLLGEDEEEEDEKNVFNFLTGAISPAFKYFSTVRGRLLLILLFIIFYFLLYKKRKKKDENEITK